MRIFGFKIVAESVFQAYQELAYKLHEKVLKLRDVEAMYEEKIHKLESLLKAEIDKNTSLENDLVALKYKNINDFEANLKDSKKKIIRMDERLANEHAKLMNRLNDLEMNLKVK